MKKAEASDPTLVFLRTELSSNKTLPQVDPRNNQMTKKSVFEGVKVKNFTKSQLNGKSKLKFFSGNPIKLIRMLGFRRHDKRKKVSQYFKLSR